MKSIKLGYGSTSIAFEYDEARFDVIGAAKESTPLSDVEIGERFERPIGSKPIDEIIKPGESVLIAVPDGTRQAGAGQIVNLLVRRLIAAGTMPFDIGVIFSTGLHRKVTEEEKKEIVTPFIAQRVKSYDHDSKELSGFLNLGKTESGIPVELNRKAVETDHLVLVGGVNFHYFAGFTGGRKLLCPGLASKSTITATHALAFDKEQKTRAAGVGPGLLKGNPVHEAFSEVVRKSPPTYTFNTFSDEQGAVTELFCGDWESSHEHACETFYQNQTFPISEKRGLVIVSGGGAPHDLNMVQAHKALETASRACKPGGTIILLAECADGMGSREFEDAFELENRAAVAEELCRKYKVGMQTAWSVLTIAGEFRVIVVSGLSPQTTDKMGLIGTSNLSQALAVSKSSETGFLMPFGSKFLPIQKQKTAD